jgi:hypothetical protein
MANYMVKLRYYVGDPLEDIKIEDLKKIGKQYGTDISYEKIENREMKNGLLMEETMNKRIEDISQEVVTVVGDDEKKFSDCIRALYKKYRSPRTAYSLMGSNETGRKIAWELMEVCSGWE